MITMTRRPSQLKFLAILGLLNLPLFYLNLWILFKAAPWGLPHFISLSTAVAAVTIMAFILTLAASPMALGVYCIYFMAQLVMNLVWFFLEKNYAILFYSLFLMTNFVVYFICLLRELEKPYYNPKVRWFEGLPRFITGLDARILGNGGESTLARISNLTEDGCFVVLDDKKSEIKTLEITLGQNVLTIPVQKVSAKKNINGFGLKFFIDQNEKRQVQEFVDRARSFGYV